jgi:hypothetical protein
MPAEDLMRLLQVFLKKNPIWNILRLQSICDVIKKGLLKSYVLPGVLPSEVCKCHNVAWDSRTRMWSRRLPKSLPLWVKWAVCSSSVAWVCCLWRLHFPALQREQADERKGMMNVTKEVNRMIYNRMGEVNNWKVITLNNPSDFSIASNSPEMKAPFNG